MNAVDIAQLIDKIRVVERKMSLVYTLFKVCPSFLLHVRSCVADLPSLFITTLSRKIIIHVY